jgi:hypothetical protein
MATGTLKSIAVIGAAPVTIMNSTPGRPTALPANRLPWGWEWAVSGDED